MMKFPHDVPQMVGEFWGLRVAGRNFPRSHFAGRNLTPCTAALIDHPKNSRITFCINLFASNFCSEKVGFDLWEGRYVESAFAEETSLLNLSRDCQTKPIPVRRIMANEPIHNQVPNADQSTLST
jgi:hypothetical protein